MSIKLPANDAKQIILMNEQHHHFHKLPKVAQKLVGHLQSKDNTSSWELVEETPECRIFKKIIPSKKVI